ncbi:MAG: cupin-like domain-containing protein [Pseudoxanthomonas sp.]
MQVKQTQQPQAASAPLIDFDETRFDPWRIQAVTHGLVGHPLLQMGALVALGERLETRGSIRTHGNDAAAGTPFGEAPLLHPNSKSAAATLSDVAHARAWMSLLNVQADPIYRSLVGEVLDSIQPVIDRHDPGMNNRGGWIFVTSPNTVTPFHFDKEHNFILQVQGRKRIYVWEPDDVVVASEPARDRFHHCHKRDRLQWREEFRERARVFDLEPGQGAYMPSTSPHLVENGDGPSITISLTYYTHATRRDALLHKAHEMMRGIGLRPSPVGTSPVLDALTCASVLSAMRCREWLAGFAGKRETGPRARFAPLPAGA